MKRLPYFSTSEFHRAILVLALVGVPIGPSLAGEAGAAPPPPCTRFLGDSYKTFKEKDKVGFLTPDGIATVPAQFDEVQPFSESYAPVRVGDKWGMIDVRGGWSLPAEYAYLGQVREGLALAQRRPDGTYGFVPRDGGTEIPFDFAAATNFHDGLAGATIDGKRWGFIDFRGKWIIEPQFEEVGLFAEGLAPAKKGGKFGFINRSGTVVIRAEYDSASTFCAGTASVTLANELLEIDRVGERAPPSIAEMKRKTRGPLVPPAYRCYPSLVRFATNGKTGFKDATGTIVIPPQFEDVGLFSEGWIPVQQNGKWGAIDYQGKWEIDPTYRFLGVLREGLAPVQPFGQSNYGFVTRSGKLVIQCKYSGVSEFRGGLAIACEDGKVHGVIDCFGKWVIPPRFETIAPFSEGVLSFRQNGLWGFLNPAGEIVIPPRYSSPGIFTSGRATVNIQNARNVMQFLTIDRFETIIAPFRAGGG